MKLHIIADDLENVVNATLVMLTCPHCAAAFQVGCLALLRQATYTTDNRVQTQLAHAEYIQVFATSITCAACKLPFPVDFAYGEMQPARYKLGLFA